MITVLAWCLQVECLTRRCYQQRFRTIAHPPDEKRRLEKRERKRRQLLDGDGLWRRTFGERRNKERRGKDEDDPAIIHLPFLDEHFDDDEHSDEQSAAVSESETDNLDAKQPAMTTDSEADDAQTDTPKKLTAQEQARLHSLRNMLDASNARYEQASKKRRPVFAAGLKVRVKEGEHMGETGVVLDADYIESRALLSLPDQNSPIWIGFRLLGNC